LLITASDLVGVWQARTAIDQFERVLGLERRRLNLVLNRHDPRFHHSPQEVEWHLGAPVVGVIPFDHAATQRAIAEQRPLVLDRASRAGRALWALAEGLNEGKLRLPTVDPGLTQRPTWWRRILGSRRPAPAARKHLAPGRTRVAVPQQQGSRAW